MKSTRECYDELREVIAERQAFENEPQNQIAPYINHRTDYNYYDVNGLTLIHYASMLGDAKGITELLTGGADIDKTPLFGGSTALQMALEAGHLDCAKELFARGAKCAQISAARVHPHCKKWFNDQIVESLQLSFPEYKQGNFNKSRDSRFFTEPMALPLPRIAELGDLEVLKIAQEKQDSEFIYKKNALLIKAAENGQQNCVEFLLSHDATLTPLNIGSENTALHAAAENHQTAMASFLIEKGAHPDYQNYRKKTALMAAIESNDIEMVQLLINKSSNIRLKDLDGRTALHYAVFRGNPKITQAILSHPDAKALLSEKDIYGFTATTAAIDAGNDEQLKLLCSDDELNAARQSADYAKKIAQTHQILLLTKMYYFLQLNYRDCECLGSDGNCNGFSFLRNFYSSLKRKQYCFNTLRMISSWDGSDQSLEKKLDTNLEQARYYVNHSELFDQWIQDVIWFQSNTKIIRIAQEQRNKQFQLLHPNTIQRTSIVTIYRCGHLGLPFSIEQLTEHLQIIQKMPAGIEFDIGGGQHTVSGEIMKQGGFILDYYDPNFKYEADPEAVSASLADIITDRKYRALKQLMIGDKMMIEFNIYYFSHLSNDINMSEFELFSNDELPTSKEDALDYQKKSPSKFTPLHAALFAGSSVSFKKLLEDGYCDITAQNAFGQTVFDMAVSSENVEIMSLILHYARDKFDIGNAIAQCSELLEDPNNVFIKVLLQHATPSDYISVCIHQIHNYNIPYIEKFILDHKDIINLHSASDKTLLFEAVLKDCAPVVSLLLKNGASVLISGETPWGGKTTLLEYIIDGNMKEHLEMIFKRDAATLLPLITAHLEGKVDSDLLEKTAFNLNNMFERHVLTILLASAMQSQNTNLFVELVKHADPDILNQSKNGIPFMLLAIKIKNLNMLQALLENGANINCTTPGGNTALHAALKFKVDKEFIQLLLEHHPDITAKNNADETPEQLAANAPTEIQEMISNHANKRQLNL